MHISDLEHLSLMMGVKDLAISWDRATSDRMDPKGSGPRGETLEIEERILI